MVLLTLQMERAGRISDEAVRRMEIREEEGVARYKAERKYERGERRKGRRREGTNRGRLADHVATIPPG